jgi:hypothetical protein
MEKKQTNRRERGRQIDGKEVDKQTRKKKQQTDGIAADKQTEKKH